MSILKTVSLSAFVAAVAIAGTPAMAQKTVLNVGMQSTDAGVLDPHLNSGMRIPTQSGQ